MLESVYQGHLIKKLKEMFPGCIVLKNDTGYQQGISDLTLLCDGPFWALLEVKRSATEHEQPNQRYFVEKADGMSFGAFIYPENEEEVFLALQRAYESHWNSRVPKR